MAEQRGGYRKPSRPAPVSGPGKLSARTDGAPQGAKYMSGGSYGEGKALMEAQSAAPMAGKAPVASVPASAVAPQPIVPLTKAGNPNTPLTEGLPYGPGAGPEASAAQFAPAPNFRNTVERLRMVDDSGDFELLAEFLDSQGLM